MRSQPVTRRAVFQGAALVGASAAGSATATDLLAGTISKESASLADRRVVMIFRHVAGLATAREFVRGLARWPGIKVGPAGEDPNVVMYDGGGAIVGLAVQAEQLAGNTCTVLDFLPANTVINPASLLAITPASGTTVRSGTAGRAGTAKASTVVDPAGNSFALVPPDAHRDPALTKKIDAIRAEAEQAGVVNPLTELRLRVSDLKTSVGYYGNQLGLRLIAADEGAAYFDVGSLVLTLETETEPGEVKRLSESGRLLHDLLVFHVDALDETMTGLLERGVGFPRGVEKSDTGRIAYFDDPDGHVLCLWTPTGRATNFDFYPQLRRILGGQV